MQELDRSRPPFSWQRSFYLRRLRPDGANQKKLTCARMIGFGRALYMSYAHRSIKNTYTLHLIREESNSNISLIQIHLTSYIL